MISAMCTFHVFHVRNFQGEDPRTRRLVRNCVEVPHSSRRAAVARYYYKAQHQDQTSTIIAIVTVAQTRRHLQVVRGRPCDLSRQSGVDATEMVWDQTHLGHSPSRVVAHAAVQNLSWKSRRT